MQITVLAIEQNNYISFKTQHGVGKGKWMGSLPKEQETYYVELELEEKFCYGKNLLDSCDKIAKLACCGEKVLFDGVLESVEEDGYAILRINDVIVPFEVAGDNNLSVGNFIILETCKVLIYPVEY